LQENRELSRLPVQEGDAAEFGDNRLIHGDNLAAMQALEQEFTGKIKCIYIDPPYNTGNAFDHYDDVLGHDNWLHFMKERLLLLRGLLTDDGLIFVQIDDNELAYLTLLMDDIFGRTNRVNTICVKMSEASGVKMAHAERRLPKLKEYILMYRKKMTPPLTPELVRLDSWNNEYKTVLHHFDWEDFKRIDAWIRQECVTREEVERCNALLRNCVTQPLAAFFREQRIKPADQEQWKFDNAWRIVQAVGSTSVLHLARMQPPKDQEIAAMASPRGILYLYKTGFDPASRQPRVQVLFAQHNLFRNPGDFWTDIKTTGGVGQEGGELFPNGKKPEKLIKRIIGMCTEPGDWVLDAFAGSGTTGAVAHKMGRKWIMIENGEHCRSHIVPRMKRVIDGTDQSGISKEVGWKGGGGFRYFSVCASS
jgi:adenine-specific DNA-methyltransferase